MVVDTPVDRAEEREARVQAAVAEICGSPGVVVAEAPEQVCPEVVAGVSDQGLVEVVVSAVALVVARVAEVAQQEAAEERAQVLVAREEALAAVQAAQEPEAREQAARAPVARGEVLGGQEVLEA